LVAKEKEEDQTEEDFAKKEQQHFTMHARRVTITMAITVYAKVLSRKPP